MTTRTQKDLAMHLQTLANRIALAVSQGSISAARDYLTELLAHGRTLQQALEPGVSLQEWVATGKIKLPVMDAGEEPDD